MFGFVLWHLSRLPLAAELNAQPLSTEYDSPLGICQSLVHIWNDTTTVASDIADEHDLRTKSFPTVPLDKTVPNRYNRFVAAATDAFYQALGRRVQSLRKKRRLTQEQLGARLSPQVTRASIANIESGKQRVYAHSLAQIADALDVVVDELIRERSVLADVGLKQKVEAHLQDRLPREQLDQLTRKLGLATEGDDETHPDPDGPQKR
jgi:transcriptional regulator with XRE-family HTH domain